MVHKHGGDVYTHRHTRDFSANINFLGMPDRVREAAVGAIAASVHYPDPEYRELRTALAKREGCRAEQIICGNGAAELMFALVQAVKPKKAVLASPSFFEYEQALQAVDCRITRYLLKKEQEFQLDEELFSSLDDSVDLLILGNPNNPTGQILERQLLEKLVQECARKEILLVLDESFFDFLSEEAKRNTQTGVKWLNLENNIVVLRSFTKMYAMPGLRFGYGLCGDTKLLEKMRSLLQPWNVSVPACEAACAAADELDFAKESAELTAKNREEMAEAMLQLGYHVYPSDTNFLLFEGPKELGERCLTAGFQIRDCSNFPGLMDGEQQTDHSWFRVCVRSREENQALLVVLGRKE